MSITIQEYKKLCSAVLIQALEDICKGGHDAEGSMIWVNNPGDDYVFDFLVVCRSLGLDARMIREVIKTHRIGDILDQFKFLLREARKKETSAPVRREYSPPSRVPGYQGRRAVSGR